MNDLLKERCKQEADLISTIRIRKLLLFSGVIYLSFYILDLYYYSNYSPAMFLSIRASVTVLLFLLYLLSFRDYFRNDPQAFGSLAIFLTSIGVGLMIYLTEGTKSNYYQGLMLVSIATFLVNSFTIRDNIKLQCVILLCYIACALGSPAPINLQAFVQALFFLITTQILMVYIVAIYSRQYRSEFEMRESLKDSQLKLTKSYDKIKIEAEYDGLTKVFNRKYFMQKLNLRITQANLFGDNFFFIILDVDRFKKINDQHGHLFGDEVLKEIIGTIQRNVREGTLIGRFGGDEFVMIFGHGTQKQIMSRLTDISNEIKTLRFDDKQIDVSVSIGVAEFKPNSGMSVNALIELADKSLFHVKDSNRGGIKINKE